MGLGESIKSSDINVSNKSTRLPIVFCIEGLNGSMIERIKDEIKKLLTKITNENRLRLGTEIGIIIFTDEVEEIRSLSEVTDTIRIAFYHQETHGSAAIGQALNRAVKSIRIRHLDYESQNLNSYPATIILFSSGNFLHDKEWRIACDDIKSMNRRGKLKLVPFSVDDSKELRSLSSNEKLYDLRSDTGNIEEIFNTIGKSIEKLSESSNNAYTDITNASISWDDFIKLAGD